MNIYNIRNDIGKILLIMLKKNLIQIPNYFAGISDNLNWLTVRFVDYRLWYGKEMITAVSLSWRW